MKRERKVVTQTKTQTKTTTQSQQKSKGAPKVVREPEPRTEERIIIKKKKNEYLDNFQYKETKEIKRNNPRYFVIVEHLRKGDIFGDGNFEKTSYERQVYSQGGNRPKLPQENAKLRGNKSEVRMTKKTEIKTSGPQEGSSTVTKRTTRTTTKETKERNPNPVSATATHEKIQQTTMKRRNEGTVQKTESRTETKTTTSGIRGQGSSSTTTKTTTKTTSEKPAGGETKKTTTTTTKTTKTEGGDASVRKKYSKKK
jgi:hypothetical protein